MMNIVNMIALSEGQIGECARILTDSLKIGYPTYEDGLSEVKELHIPENSMLAVLDGEEVVAWGGIQPHYSGHVFEMHPIVVKEGYRGKGLGRMLVSALENIARARSGLVMMLGTDDEGEGETSLAKVDLFWDLPGKLSCFIG
jgi:aminoglycoside 6'-N-acetyltransferase I